jgi:hypothetical protein
MIPDIIQQASDEGCIADYDRELASSEKKDKFDDHKRAASYKQHLHCIVVSGMWVVGLIIISLVIIRAWHLASPDCFRWLSGAQIHGIDTLLFSSVIFSLVSRYFSYYNLFQKKENPFSS